MISISWTFVARLAGAAFLSAFCATAGASFHLYKIEQIYSDASGNVQYVMFATPDTPFAAGQQFLTTHQVVAANSSNNDTYTFMSDLPATMAHTTQSTKFLVATQSFANLGLVIPDYIVPDKFLFIPDGNITYVFADFVSYSALPTDGIHAIDRTGNVVVASPTNFAGNTSGVNVPPPTPKGIYDIDANGQVDALTDGLLLMRYLQGLRGAALIQNAVGPNAGRNTSSAVEAHIAGQIPP